MQPIHGPVSANHLSSAFWRIALASGVITPPIDDPPPRDEDLAWVVALGMVSAAVCATILIFVLRGT